MAKILLVEDDQDIARLVTKSLVDEQHVVEHLSNGAEVLEFLRLQEYDLLILDWNLPGLSGLEICQQFRQEGGQTPILFLTGKGEISEKELGLDAGADDYLTKPFSTRELSARLRALLRRPALTHQTVLQAGDLCLDPNTCQVTKAGKTIELPPKEFALLEFFMRHPGVVFSGDALISRVWPTDSEATALSVRVRITKLRSKIDTIDKPSLIRNVFNRGYVFDQSEKG
jgi:DNA-binding response OmpR family regulator